MPLHKDVVLSPVPGRRNFRASVMLALAAGMILLLPLHLWAGSHKRPKQTAPPDSGYVSALAAANHFLHAWQMGDLEAGMVLLDDRVRHSQNPDKFEEFFSSGSDRAFEIARGTGNRGRYRFAVVLVTSRGNQVRRKFSEIVVVDTGKNDWAVDKLP